MKSMEKMLLILLPVLLIFTITAFNANQPTVSEAETRASERGPEEPPMVFMTKDISSQGLMWIYETLNREATGKVAVKISTGEPGSHYLDANLVNA